MPKQILQFEIRERERVNDARGIFDFLKFNQSNLKRAIF